MQKLNIPRCPLRKQVLTTAGLTDMMSGEGLALFAKLSLPDVGQTRRALLRLRIQPADPARREASGVRSWGG